MADLQSRTIKPEGLAMVMIVFTIVLFVLNTTVVALRIWVRAWMFDARKVWGWDDTVICMSYVAYIPGSTFAIFAAYHGVGTRDSRLDAAHIAMGASDLGYWEIGYAVSVNLAKASIALATMRICTDRRYIIALWGFMLSEMAISLICLITFWIICTPPGAQWDTSLGSCKSYTLIPLLSWPFSAVNLISDWACAVVPFLMMRKLNMQRRLKYSIVAVLGLGGSASIGAIARFPYLKHYLIPEDRLYYFGYVIIWSMFENGIGIFAACLPPLNKLITFFGPKSDSRPSAKAGAKETIGGTPLSTLGSFPKRRKTSKSAPVMLDSQWSRLADEESNSDCRREPSPSPC